MKEATYPKRLFKLQVLLWISMSIVLLLIAVFPWRTAHYLMNQGTPELKEQFSSRLKTEYYQMLNSKAPLAKEVLSLAQTLTNKNLWKISTNLLSKKLVLNQLEERQSQNYHLITLDNNIGIFHKYKNETKEKNKLKQNIRQQLLATTKSNILSNTSLQNLARSSSAFELNPLASQFYERLAQNNLQYKTQWYAQAGRLAILSGDDSRAADMFKHALNSATSIKYLNQNMQNWLAALNQAKQFSQIEEFINQVKDHPNKYQNSLGIIASASAKSGYPSIATYLFHYLAQNTHPKQRQRWYEKAAHWATVAEKYDYAIELLLQAQKKSTHKGDQWVIKQRLVDLYIKADNTDAALEIVVNTMKTYPNDMRLIDKAVDIALASKKLKIARNINLSYLKKRPNSVSALMRQATIESADKKYDQAFHYLNQAITVSPNNLAPHRLWADLEETQKNYALALDKWTWIYKQDDSKQHRLRLINIAQANITERGLQILQTLSQTGELPRQAIYDVFYQLIDDKKVSQAIVFLRKYLKSHKPDKKLYITLAKWQSSQKSYAKSLSTWNKLEKYYGPNKASSLSRFELLWLQNKNKAAYRLWNKNKAVWGKSVNTRYLSIMAEIAWQYKYTKTALSYYSSLLNRKYKRSRRVRTLQYMRISELQTTLGREDKALSTLSQGFYKTANTQLLLKGLQLSFDLYDDDSFEHFVSLAEIHQTKIKNTSRYWVLLGAYDQRYSRFRTALEYYRHALAINPKSRDAYIGIEAIRKAGIQ